MDEELDLPRLFAAADEIGDQYLTEKEIADRNAELAQVQYETWMSLTDEDLELI
jgi:hypothetical protein